MNPKKILLVEDNADDEALTIRALRKGKVVNDIVVLRDGAAAVDYILCQGEYSDRDITDMPQVVLLDLNLPKLNGLEVLKKVRENEHTKVLPIVLLTSSKEEKDILGAYDYGANSYVSKPVEIEKFMHSVQQLGLYWMLLNENCIGMTKK